MSQQLSLCRVGLVKLLPIHRNSVDTFFHYSVLQEYWVQTESRILLKPLQGGVIIAVLISSHEQTQ